MVWSEENKGLLFLRLILELLALNILAREDYSAHGSCFSDLLAAIFKLRNFRNKGLNLMRQAHLSQQKCVFPLEINGNVTFTAASNSSSVYRCIFGADRNTGDH